MSVIASKLQITTEQVKTIRSTDTCSICKAVKGKIALHIDHDHKTNKIRGLLCSKCNQAIGLLNESPALLDQAKAYLANPPMNIETGVLTPQGYPRASGEFTANGKRYSCKTKH
jgi:hypothetical protein